MSQAVKEKVVGGLVFVVFGLAIVFSYGAGGLAEKSRQNGLVISATFNRVDGLSVGDDVRLGGIRIGTVADQQLDANFRAKVIMRIDSDIPLPRDTSVAILTDGLFGEKYLEMEPGGDPEPMKTGDEIQFAQDAVIVSELLDLIISQGKARLAEENKEPAVDAAP